MYQIDEVSRKIAFNKQEAVRVGQMIVLTQDDQEVLRQLQQHFLVRGFRVCGTRHFVVCQKSSSRYTVLMHQFRQAELDADLICFIEDELIPFGIIPSAKDFGAVLFAVLASTFSLPRDQQIIWQHFCVNTLAKLRDRIVHPSTVPPTISYITPFAAIYRRVFELCVGGSFLDVGCSFGFLPVLIAEHVPGAHIIGCDNNPDALRFSTDLATISGVRQITFSLQDILDPAILSLGIFNTVTVLHVLEHLSEQEIPVALTHLLQLTEKRLIIAVPYEERAQRPYGHQQVFTPEKLHGWGRWCINMLGGAGQYWCEDVMGGMLVVERLTRSEQR